MNKAEAEQLKKLEESETCPTCGGPMKAKPMQESEYGPEQGGSHGLWARLTGTEVSGYRLKRGQKISGG